MSLDLISLKSFSINNEKSRFDGGETAFLLRGIQGVPNIAKIIYYKSTIILRKKHTIAPVFFIESN